MNPAILAAGLGVFAVLLFVELRQVLVERSRPVAAQPRREAPPPPAVAEPVLPPAPVPERSTERADAPALTPRRAYGGAPGRLGVPGEESDLVLHRRPGPEEFSDQKLLVVGAGDAAVETALGLLSRGNTVALASCGRDFVGLKPNNDVAIRAAVAAGRVTLHFSSEVRRFAPGEAVLSFDGPAGRGEFSLSVDRSFVLGA